MVRRLATLMLLVACSSSGADEPSRYGLSAAVCAEGWIGLFDGRSLFGWQATSDANWQVTDESITVTGGAGGFLHTTTQFADFELQLEYRCDEQTNSGVFVRSSIDPQGPQRDCYEINIAPPDNPFPTGSIVARHKTAARITNEGAWHRMSIRARGGDFQVSIDGQLVSQYNDPQPLGRGHIGLQYRGRPISFRNIRLRPLGLASLFHGTDLTGWNTQRTGASRFFAEDGMLRVLDGRGQLETESSFGDFVLQLEAKTHAPGLNSGIFFRCIQGDEMMGYESQIHNGFDDDDPTRPTDCGTGGIFRRQKARRVVSNDLEWFAMTILAQGAHLATWVNGYQVTDWTDERTPHHNPRKGLRTAAGTIMIQGHDPTTDLSFRNLRAAELAPRGPAS